jgi:hypothetical protein
MRKRAIRFIGLAAAVVVSASLSLGASTPAGADAGSSKPPPTDRSQKNLERGRKAAPQEYAGKYKRNPLLKELLSEEDEGGAEPEPAASALCQRFINAPNPYADPFPNVDQIRGDAIAVTGTQAGCSTAQNETTIAVNPENPRNLVAGANDYRLFNTREDRNDASGWAYTSLNGGRTWRNIQLPHLTFQTQARGALSYMDSAGDPVVAFGPRNTVYYGNIVFSRAAPASGGTEPASAITVNVSHDGGLTWGEPVIVAIDGVNSQGQPRPTTVFNDKVWLAADPHNGRVYVTWTRFADQANGDYLESPIVVARSDNYGRSFSAFTRVDPPLAQAGNGFTPFSQGSNPRVGRDGTLYIAYESTSCRTVACDQPDDRDVTQMATSRDRGRTFRRVVVDTNFDFPLNEDAGTPTLTGQNFRINSYPQLTYDSRTRRLVVTWNDDRNGVYDADGRSVRTNGDNIVATSRNGSNWSTPVVVGTPQDEVFGAVAATRRVVAVTSYTRHYDPSGVKLDYAAWSSRGLPRSGTRISRVTTQSSDPRIQFVAAGLQSGKDLQGVFIGDYTAVALGADLRLHPSWTDFRGRPGATKPNQDAYTATIPLRSDRRR